MNKQQFGNFIAENRKTAGLTQKALAERLHVTDKAVSKWERALSYPDVTLLEPLAEALDLGVEELMACRRTERKQEEEPMQNLLEISRENLKEERRKNLWRIAVLALVMLSILLAAVWYRGTYVSGRRLDAIVLKETVGGENYIYVEEGSHLIRLKCGESVDFDGIGLAGGDTIYDIDCRWNQRTYEGTARSCEATHQVSLGSVESMIGSSIGLDDPLFGYPMVWCRYTYAYADPEVGPVFTYTFWVEEEDDQKKNLLEVEDCQSYTVADWDGDGEPELVVRTRWPEKPYTVYSMEDGSIEAFWPDAVSPELMERLLTDKELYERDLARMGQNSGTSDERGYPVAPGEPL